MRNYLANCADVNICKSFYVSILYRSIKKYVNSQHSAVTNNFTSKLSHILTPGMLVQYVAYGYLPCRGNGALVQIPAT
jgi:hypothetical protein